MMKPPPLQTPRLLEPLLPLLLSSSVFLLSNKAHAVALSSRKSPQHLTFLPPSSPPQLPRLSQPYHYQHHHKYPVYSGPSPLPPPRQEPLWASAISATDQQHLLLTTLTTTIQSSTFVKLVLKNPLNGPPGLISITGRVVDLKKRGACFQLLYHYDTNDVTKNHPVSELEDVMKELFSSTTGGGQYRSIRLFSITEDLLVINGKVQRSKPAVKVVPDRGHDRTKKRLLMLPLQQQQQQQQLESSSLGGGGGGGERREETWIERLGVLGPNGEPRRG